MGIPRQIEIGDRPELLEFIKQTASSDGSVQLLDNGLPVAVISSLAGSSHLLARTKPVTADDPLFRLVGIGESETPGDAAEHKNEYLVRAKRSLTECHPHEAARISMRHLSIHRRISRFSIGAMITIGKHCSFSPILRLIGFCR